MQEPGKSAVRDSVYTLIGGMGPLVIALVTIPLLIDHIGAARFGGLTIVWLMLNYFGQADFGIGRAVTQRIAASAEGDQASRARTICTALVLILGIGSILALVAGVSAHWFFAGPFQTSSPLRKELADSIWWIAASIPVVALFGIAHGSLIGSRKFGTAAWATFAGNGAMQLFPLAAAIWWSGEMPNLIVASLAGRVIGLCIAVAGMWAFSLKGNILRANRDEARNLLHLGKWIMATALVSPLMVVTDRFAIGVQMGAFAVAAYAVPYQVASRTLVLPQAAMTAMFPRFAAMSAQDAQAAAARVIAAIGNAFAVPIIFLICMAEPLLRLWIGADLDPRSILVGRILLAGIWINAVSQVPYNLLQARGRPRLVAQLHLIELPVYAVLLVTLGSAFGLAGIALAFALRCAVDGLALSVTSGIRVADVTAQLRIVIAAILGGVLLDPILDGWTSSIAAATILGGVAAWRAWATTPPELYRALGRKAH